MSTFSETLLEQCENEIGDLYFRAYTLASEFIVNTKHLRMTGGRFQWYEPRVRADRGSVDIAWQLIKVVKKRDGTFTSIVKHIPKGRTVKTYSQGLFGLALPEEKALIAELETEFTLIRKHNEKLVAIKRLARGIKKFEH